MSTVNGYTLIVFLSFFVAPLCQGLPRVRPGDGYPGRLAPYSATLELRKKMARFRMSAGWFHRNPLPEPPRPEVLTLREVRIGGE